MGINIPGEGTRGRSIALPEISSLRKESTNTYFSDVRGCRGGGRDYPPVKADSTEDAAGMADRGSHPARIPARRPEADASLRVRERAEAAWKGPVVTH